MRLGHARDHEAVSPAYYHQAVKQSENTNMHRVSQQVVMIGSLVCVFGVDPLGEQSTIASEENAEYTNYDANGLLFVYFCAIYEVVDDEDEETATAGDRMHNGQLQNELCEAGEKTMEGH